MSVKPLSALPEDLKIKIILLLDAKELLRISESTREWNRLTHMDDIVWMPLALSVWKKISFNSTSRSLLTRIKDLGIADLKKSLSRVDCLDCTEKSEFQRRCLAYMTFLDKLRKTAQSSYYTSRYITLPEWAMRIGEWKVINSTFRLSTR